MSFDAKPLSFQFIANACGIFTGKNGTRVLCDPWLVDGVFEGSWCHFHKLKTTPQDVQDVDAIYVSHLHPDHYDERFFDFDRSKPIIVLDHGPNFLIKKLESRNFTNLIRIKNGQTVTFREFEITMFAPFAKHNFHDAAVGNLIDSAMVISCDGVVAFNANDNTASIEAGIMLRERFGSIDLAMMNFNAAGPYPSCFDNLTLEQKYSEQARIIERNFNHMRNVLLAMQPQYLLPFAGAFVLGGDLHPKNAYLGTTTWDACAEWMQLHGVGETQVITLREMDRLNVKTGAVDKPYIPIDTVEVERYIATELALLRYPYQSEAMPVENQLVQAIERAAAGMKTRMERFGIHSDFTVILRAFDKRYVIYPEFQPLSHDMPTASHTLECSMDERLLEAILTRRAQWNNAEVGCHINFIRTPNQYEPDLHTGLQFFHL